MMLYSASVVVPWWDHTDLLQLWETNVQHLQEAEIIFVDNGSAPQGKAELKAFCQRHSIHLLRNESNRGYAVANNQGAAIARGTYILFFNNDLEILSSPVQYLCELAGDGIAGPGPLLTETHELSVEGWALCLKKVTLEAIGGWCEAYGAGYWDDVDLCYRAVLQGIPLKYAAGLRSENWQACQPTQQHQTLLIRHLGGTTGDDGRLEKQALNSHNREHFTRKFYPSLRDINLIIFPDWEQPEELLASEIMAVIQAMQSHAASAQMSLLVDSGNASDEDIYLFISGIVMAFLLNAPLESTAEPVVSVTEKFHQAYWAPWKRRLHARILLFYENAEAILTRGEGLPAYSVDRFHQTQAVLAQGEWALLSSLSSGNEQTQKSG